MILKDLYQGSTKFYGQLNGKNYFTVKGKITDQVWDDHLHGRVRLGVIPNRDGKIKFASIDVDMQGSTVNQVIMNHMDKLGLEYVREKSKSKGYHYNIFFKDWVNGQMAHDFLYEEFRKRYGVEVFPTNPNTAVGNFINVPYFGLYTGHPDTYFLDHPKKPPLIVPYNWPDVIRPVIKIKQETFQGTDDAERACRINLGETHFPHLKPRMYCMFYRKTGKSKSGSYFKGNDGVYFYKEFGRMENGKEFVLNNIQLVSRMQKIDRMKAISFILDGDVTANDQYLRVLDAVEELGDHELFKRYRKLKPFIFLLAEWIRDHAIDGKAFISQRYLAELLGYNLTTIEYLTNISCLLGLWLKDGSSNKGLMSVTSFKFLNPDPLEVEERATLLSTLKNREIKPERLAELGFSWQEIARAFVNKGECYKAAKKASNRNGIRAA